MRRPNWNIFLFLLAFLLLSMPLFSLAAETFTGKVVSDGDTIKVMRTGRAVKVRLHGIDCPERKQPYGTKAKRFTSGRAFRNEVEVWIKPRTGAGRIVGEVTLPDGLSLNKELLYVGLAWTEKGTLLKIITLQWHGIVLVTRVIKKVCDEAGIKEEELRKGGRRRKVSHARARISHRLGRELGIPAAEIARHLGFALQPLPRLFKSWNDRVKSNNFQQRPSFSSLLDPKEIVTVHQKDGELGKEGIVGGIM